MVIDRRQEPRLEQVIETNTQSPSYFRDKGVSKGLLIELLKTNGTKGIEFLEHSDVNEENLIFILRQRKIKVSEQFFADLAGVLEIPYIEEYSAGSKKNLASVLPYGFLKENLIVPLEIGENSASLRQQIH